MTYRDQVVIITGASSGLGRELARQLGAEGARLALLARRREALDAVAAEVRARGGQAEVIPTDVTDPAVLAAAFAEAERRLGPPDVVVLNAGVGEPTTVRRYDAGVVANILSVNLVSIAHALGAVIPGMVERRRGQIVAISSLASYRSFPGSWAYCASKAGLSALLEGLRLELRPYGVAVTTICPGFVRTEMTAANKLPMPFLLDCDDATRRIVRAMRARRSVYNFPWPMYLLIRLSRLLPEALVAKVSQPSPSRRAQ